MIDAETARFLEGGCSIVVGTVGPDGEPFVTRGWGLTVLPDDTVRLLLDAGPDPAVAQLAAGARIAVTATSVRTLHSRQLKGRATGLEPATDDDRDKASRHCVAFYGDIVETDHTDPALPPRLTPDAFVACTVEIDELFDQTPGPNAGANVPAATP